MTKLEEVAKAIYDRDPLVSPKTGENIPWADAGEWDEGWRDHCMECARAAVRALREPDDAMKAAGGLKCEAIMFEGDPDGTGVIFNDMGHVFTAMIDTILSEKEQGNG